MKRKKRIEKLTKRLSGNIVLSRCLFILMLVSPCTHRNWQCRGIQPKGLVCVGTSKCLSVILLSYSVIGIKKEMEKLNDRGRKNFSWWGGRGNKTNQTEDRSKISTEALNCCPFLLLAKWVAASQLNKKRNRTQSHKGHCQKRQKVDLIFSIICISVVFLCKAVGTSSIPPPAPPLCATQPCHGWVPPVRAD